MVRSSGLRETAIPDKPWLSRFSLIPAPVPIALADLVLRLAEAKSFRVLWSAEILEELERNLATKIGLSPVAARKRTDAMRTHFPDALVEDYESFRDAMTCDPKDRHVLAAAVRANAEVLVTFNIKDFPATAVKPYDIDVVRPDDFLLDQMDLGPATVLQCLQQQVSAYQNPNVTLGELLAHFETLGLPLFVAAVRERLQGE